VSPMPLEGGVSFRWRPWLCQALSGALHAAFFLAGGFLLTVAAEFGVDAGTGGHALIEPQEMHAEVEIVEYEATPKVLPVVDEPVVTEEPVIQDEPVVAKEPSIQEEVQEPEMPPVAEPSPTATPEPVVPQEAEQWMQPAPVPTPIAKPPRRKPVASGTPGNSTRREKAAASGPATAASGAKSARADYLRNPPPVYPAEAKRNGQQGLSCRRERWWARGISDADQKLRLSNSGQFGARGGAQMEVPSGDHRRSQGFLYRESSRSIHARLEARS
jgi:outer membrane biosynthesis protein TonB